MRYRRRRRRRRRHRRRRRIELQYCFIHTTINVIFGRFCTVGTFNANGSLTALHLRYI